MDNFRMAIALMSDFGTRDHYVAAVKGTILSIDPDVTIVDITHEIEPQNIREAAFTLHACFRDFPPGTIFVAVVDPGVGSARRAVLVLSAGCFFIAPDNGLLGMAIGKAEDIEAFEVTNHNYFRKPVSDTFHGRDIFAPVAANLSKGVEPAEFGPRVDDVVRLELPAPEIHSPSEVRGEVLHIDRFGNVVTNLRPADLWRGFCLEVNGKMVSKTVGHYEQGTAGELFALTGSSGLVEISVVRASAARALNARVGDPCVARLAT